MKEEICPVCGETNVEHGVFCSYCGHKFPQKEAPLNNNEQAVCGNEVGAIYHNGKKVYNINDIKKDHYYGRTGIIFGVLSFFFAIPFTFMGLYYSIKGLKDAKLHDGAGKSESITGLVINIFSLIIMIIIPTILITIGIVLSFYEG